MITPYCTLAQVKYALDLEKTKDDLWIEELLDRTIGYCFQQEGTPTEPAIHYYHGSGTPQRLIGGCLEIVKVGEYVLPRDVFPSAGSWDITSDCFQRLVGVSGLFFGSNQRFANARIKAYLFIDGLTSLFKMCALLLLPLFKKIAQNTILHFQRSVGQHCCKLHQRGNKGRVPPTIFKAS